MHRGFTLIELLVVIAIIAILAVVVVLTLNPAQMLAQSRDSNRISDMSTLNTAINLYTTDQSGGSGFSLGSSSVVYVSIPDPTAPIAGSNCASLGLPALPSTYTYHCAASSTFRNTNGTGWIPVNFSNISTGSPLGNLPVDPTNNSSSRLYYTYTANGSQFETTAAMESAKYKLGGSNDQISGDGGTLASVFEKGSKLGLEPLDYGDNSLVGLWTMDEGTGSTSGVSQTADMSGNVNAGTWYGTAAGTNSTYYSPGKVGPWAGAFDGNSTYVSVSSSALVLGNQLTLSVWANKYGNGNQGARGIMISDAYNFIDTCSPDHSPAEAEWNVESTNGIGRIYWNAACPNTSTWYQYTGTYNGSLVSFYVNGILVSTSTLTGNISSAVGYTTIGDLGWWGSNPFNFNGLIDDVRIYNRALSGAEVQAMYNGGK